MTLQRNRISRIVLALGVAIGLSACASVDVSRDLPAAGALDAAAAAIPAARTLDISVAAINVTVPDTLKSTELNSYYPNADIVWHGDPAGDRHAQVRAVLLAAFQEGTAGLSGARAAVLDITVTKFHALTPKARYTVGGRHEIEFELRVTDAATGALLMPPRHVVSRFKALGGEAAVAAEAQGITQTVRITRHMAGVIRAELGAAGNFALAGL